LRQILMTTLLILTVVAIYMGVVDGSEGTGERIRSSGDTMADGISRISP